MSRATAKKILSRSGPQVGPATTQARPAPPQQRPTTNPDAQKAKTRDWLERDSAFAGSRAGGTMARKPAPSRMFRPDIKLDPSQVEDRETRIRRKTRTPDRRVQ